MTQKEIMCRKCKHNVVNSSCGGSCAQKGNEILEKISEELELPEETPEGESEREYLQSCQILMRYPEDQEKLNPHDCKYFMHSAICFR